MKIDELNNLLESAIKDLTEQEGDLTEVVEHLASKRRLEEKFQQTLDLNEDYIIEASTGNPDDVPVDMKRAMYDVMVEVHEILSIQDQMELPN